MGFGFFIGVFNPLRASNAAHFGSLSDLMPPSSSLPSSAKRLSLFCAVAFAKPGIQHGETVSPQVSMLCQMELTSHLLTQTVMESCAVNEMGLSVVVHLARRARIGAHFGLSPWPGMAWVVAGLACQKERLRCWVRRFCYGFGRCL